MMPAFPFEVQALSLIHIYDGPAVLSFHVPMGGSRVLDLTSNEEFSFEGCHLTLSLDGCSSRILKIVG